jgi:hypothetical protein
MPVTGCVWNVSIMNIMTVNGFEDQNGHSLLQQLYVFDQSTNPIET